MFEGDFRERTESEILLPRKNYEDFVEFLRCIYPDKMKVITARNVYMILPLAHEYSVERMMKRCQDVLMRTVRKNYKENVEELYRHIHFSEMYSLEELKEKCIYLASEHTLKQFKTAKEMYQITDASHGKIIELAPRRHELNKADEKVFTAKTKLQFYSEEPVQCDLNGKLITNGRRASDVCQALRIIERFKFTTNTSNNIESSLLEKVTNPS
ncbi:BTB and MATH domain-containing protein 36-like [Ruditapes philippinarum]|uniref:BTB and MATH domain-containing protein 36-like n=1 Tax=Ruditapes philippinarum TaxID=129788 RepID=UPI00295AA37D|nr:BTB and MATH domain-containing protein 36-like [Ruditapes philippinarum]